MTGPFPDLRSFLQALRQRGELREVHAEVDPYLEIAEIHRRTIVEQGPALFFNKVKGSPFPVVTNLFGTKARVDLAFGTKGPEIIAQLLKAPHELFPISIKTIWEKGSILKSLFSVGTDQVGNAPILDVCESPPKLSALPALTTWVKDGGPFLTLPLVYTQHPEASVSNLGIYRMQVYDDFTTGMHMQIGKGGGFHLACAKDLGKTLPVNVFLGGPPVMLLAAIAPLPENIPEVLLASFLLERRLPLAKNGKELLPLLAEAEFVLAGSVDPNETQAEGPFGDHYGYYSLQHDFPVFRCHALYRRKNPIFPATVVGKPKQEDFFIADYLQELLSPLFPIVMPAVKQLWSYGETGFHSLAAAVIQERYKREAMVSAFRILGEGQLALTKFLLLTDANLDLRDFKKVFEHILERADFRTDLYVFSNLSMDTLDYTGPRLNEGSKGVLLGIGPPIRTLNEEFQGELPRPFHEAVSFCRGCLVVSGPSYSEIPDLAQIACREQCFQSWPLIVLADNAKQTTDTVSAFLWTTFTRFEPAGDIHAKQIALSRFHPVVDLPVVIDSRMKPQYPEELVCDDKTKALVDKRWKDYFK